MKVLIRIFYAENMDPSLSIRHIFKKTIIKSENR
jgi:hypothetical protein